MTDGAYGTRTTSAAGLDDRDVPYASSVPYVSGRLNSLLQRSRRTNTVMSSSKFLPSAKSLASSITRRVISSS